MVAALGAMEGGTRGLGLCWAGAGGHWATKTISKKNTLQAPGPKFFLHTKGGLVYVLTNFQVLALDGCRARSDGRWQSESGTAWSETPRPRLPSFDRSYSGDHSSATKSETSNV